MKEYIKPYVEAQLIEFNDIILASITTDESVFDVGNNPAQIFD